MRTRVSTRSTVAMAAAAALVLAACGDEDGDEGGAAPQEPLEQEPGAEDDPLAGLEEAPEAEGEVIDGVFTGIGVLLPVPEGFELDPAAQAQGLVAAISQDQTQQLLGQAVDAESLGEVEGESLTVETLVEENRTQLGDDPTVDEPIELSGAAEAYQLSYDAIETGMEGEPESRITLLFADDGDGRLAQFTYIAPVDEYDEAVEEELLASAGFDPDSEPVPPIAPGPAPEGELEGEPEGEPEGDVDG